MPCYYSSMHDLIKQHISYGKPELDRSFKGFCVQIYLLISIGTAIVCVVRFKEILPPYTRIVNLQCNIITH